MAAPEGPAEGAPISLQGGRYVLVKPLGEGGMATVYRAWDQRLRVWRAVKILMPRFAKQPKLRERFDVEARTMAALEHRNIVRVYDVGNDGIHVFIVMELVEGGSLVDWIEEHGAMPPRMALEAMIQVDDGIETAHQRGVVHRDIKPHNVLVTSDCVCRVTDFGIARAAGDDQNLTKTGSVMGTWGFMAPEQRMDAKGVDARADVYALTATLFSLLTGNLPMDLFALDETSPEFEKIDRTLVPIVLRGAKYKRNERIQSVAELTAELRRAIPLLPPVPEGTPPLARKPGPSPEIPKVEYVATTDVPAQPAPPPSLPPSAGPVVSPTAIPGVYPPGVYPTGVYPPTQATGPFAAGTLPGQSTMAGRVKAHPRVFRLEIAAAVVLGVLGVAMAGIAAYLLLNELLRDPSDQPADVSGDPVADVGSPEADAGTDAGTDPGTDAGTDAVTDAGTEASPATAGTGHTTADKVTRPTPPPAVPPTNVIIVKEEDPFTAPASEQCIEPMPPAAAAVGNDAVFRARLCNEDGTALVLWYRPAGMDSWSSASMPRVLGQHTAKVVVDTRFAGGIDYWMECGTITKGSAASPLRVPVN